jgi:hypothetical protein
MEVAGFSETLVPFYLSTQHHMPEDGNLHTVQYFVHVYNKQGFKYCILIFVHEMYITGLQVHFLKILPPNSQYP